MLGALGLAAVALPLAACGIRLEDDAPRVPLIPTREPIPGEAFLIDLWLGSGELAAQGAALAGDPASIPARLVPLHREQERTVRDLLETLSVPERVLSDAAAARRASALRTATGPPTAPGSSSTSSGRPAGTPTTAPPAAARPTPAALGQAEASALTADAFSALAQLEGESRSVAGAALAQRAAGAALLSGSVTWAPDPLSAPALGSGLLEATRAAVYGFEVVAAQSNAAQRGLATATLAELRATAGMQLALAGSSAAAPALGYPLPFPVATPVTAHQLAQHVLRGLRQACAAQLASAEGSAQLSSVVRWLAQAEGLASRWGLALQPFPGLT